MNELLIVPCGIETCKQTHVSSTSLTLLIVPCGIETQSAASGGGKPPPPFNRTLWNWNLRYTRIIAVGFSLLIVPCGIETAKFFSSMSWSKAFNRTLWNWNLIIGKWYYYPTWSFNRTLWNWNRLSITVVILRHPLLIVPCGIETW